MEASRLFNLHTFSSGDMLKLEFEDFAFFCILSKRLRNSDIQTTHERECIYIWCGEEDRTTRKLVYGGFAQQT
jgi:hypothetical protein